MSEPASVSYNKEQVLALKILTTAPKSADDPHLLPQFQHECIRLASLVPPLTGYPKNATLRRDVPYLPPRWLYGYVYSPQQAIEACKKRREGRRKTGSVEDRLSEESDDESCTAELREIAAEWRIRKSVWEILEGDYDVRFEYESGWEDGKVVQVLALGDTWDLPGCPTDDQMEKISNLLFGEATRRPMWYVDRQRCLWKPVKW
ncbi:hypothetical protein ONZ45_g5895 [Pleurotus djamor]|nr:hypothetical protein ONZ45_g5895 [Pleurotus djamor]